MSKLPHPSDLAENQVIMSVLSYDEHFDTFAIHIDDASPCAGQDSLVPAMLMPKLTGEYGEPNEFVGRAFLITSEPPKKVWKLGDVICEEHGTKLGDADLVACCKEAYEEDGEKWDDLSEQEQFGYQIGWVEPMPHFGR